MRQTTLPMKTRRNRQNRRPILTPIILVLALICFIHTHLLAGPVRPVVHAQTTLPAVAVHPAPTTTPQPAALSERDANIAIIRKVWGTDWQIGVAIADCESGLRADAVNRHNTDRSIDVGLFEVNSVHGWSEQQMLSPVANAGYAYAIYRQQGTTPWLSSEGCWGKETR
jgi:hypothetical protein